MFKKTDLDAIIARERRNPGHVASRQICTLPPPVRDKEGAVIAPCEVCGTEFILLNGWISLEPDAGNPGERWVVRQEWAEHLKKRFVQDEHTGMYWDNGPARVRYLPPLTADHLLSEVGREKLLGGPLLPPQFGHSGKSVLPPEVFLELLEKGAQEPAEGQE